MFLFHLLNEIVKYLFIKYNNKKEMESFNKNKFLFIQSVFILQLVINISSKIFYDIYLIDEHILKLVIWGGFIYILKLIKTIIKSI